MDTPHAQLLAAAIAASIPDVPLDDDELRALVEGRLVLIARIAAIVKDWSEG